MSQDEVWAKTALELKNGGYNASVVARKMITEHGMSEPAAEALVSDLYGKQVSARAGDTIVPVGMGVGMILLGVAGIVFALTGDYEDPDGDGVIGITGLGATLALAGIGKTFFAVVNRNANEDLKNPPREEDE